MRESLHVHSASESFRAPSASMAASSLPVVLCKLAQGHDHSGLISRAAKLQGLLLPCLAKKWRVKYPQAVNVVFCSSRCERIALRVFAAASGSYVSICQPTRANGLHKSVSGEAACL